MSQQPVVVYHTYLKHDNHVRARSAPRGSKEAARFRAIRGKAAGSIRYYQMRARGPDEPARKLFTRDGTVSRAEATRMMDEHQARNFLVHRIVLTPGEGRDGEDLREMTRDVLAGLEEAKGQRLHWVAVEHRHPSKKGPVHPHIHIAVFGGGEEANSRGEYVGGHKAVRLTPLDYDRIKHGVEEYCRDRQRERELSFGALDGPDGGRARTREIDDGTGGELR